MAYDYDFAVIGGGSAGYAAARTAAGLGLKTVVIEGGPQVGGLCILRGCMPSKTLIETANRYRTLRDASEFGLYANDIGYDGTAIIARKRRLIKEFADYRAEQLESGKFTFIRGKARFTDPHTLDIALLDGSAQTVTARSFLIATGSVLTSPPVPGLAESGAWTSDDVLDKAEIPKSIIVLGAGPVALELAHYYNALGVEVTIIQRGEQVLKGLDPDVAEVVEQAFVKRDARVFKKTKLIRVERDGERFRVVFEHDGSEKSVEADALLNALGRKPATAHLGLDAAGVELDDCRIKANAHLQTSVPHIFAAGDCTGPYEIVHIAIEQAEIAARNIARLANQHPQLESIDYRLKLYAVFTEPQVGTVGLTEAEAKEKGYEILTASYPFNDHGKSMVMNEMEGFVKLIVEKNSREILGGTVVGPHASDLIQEIVVAMRFRSTAGQLALIPHYHPTLAEIWTYPASDLAEELP
jgi:pyruvate/2-oxoglutarate dehydrogenase complex dihydrolipoamide dehydrogenase (E3) component